MIWAPCSSGEGADGLAGIWGHGGMSLDMCTCTCMHAHARNAKINMLGNCKWPPPWRLPCLPCLTCMHVCAHVCACACMRVHVHMCMGGAPTQPNPHPSTHPPPGGYPLKSVKTTIRLERIEIFRFRLKILESVENSPPMGGCFFWWVGGWMGGLVGQRCEIIKILIKLDLIEIIDFCLKIYDFVDTLPPLDGCMGGWLGGWVGQCVSSCQNH